MVAVKPGCGGREYLESVTSLPVVNAVSSDRSEQPWQNIPSSDVVIGLVSLLSKVRPHADAALLTLSAP